MSKSLNGSICLTDLIELAKQQDKSFTKAKNGKIYCSVKLWINDEKDQYGNIASIQTTFKDATKEQKKYFGNFKEFEKQEPQPITQNDFPESIGDDLPF